MDFETPLKFVHILAGILWVGGGFAVIMAGIILTGRSTAQTQLAVVQAIALLAPRLFVPMSVLTLASGVALLFLAGWGWQPFTVLGLAGVIFTAGFGALVLSPACERAVHLSGSQGAEAAIPAVRRMHRLAMLDYSVQFSIVLLMVVKPGWGDFAVFGGIAAFIALGVFVGLRPPQRVAI